MKIVLATDHAGFAIKEKVKAFLQEKGYEVEDCGAFTVDPTDDYPDFISKAAEKVSADPENIRGIIFGGSGQGEAIVANKFKGVRCGLFYGKVVATSAVDAEGKESSNPFEVVALTREHNLANMLSLGVRFLTGEDALEAVKQWLETNPTTQERHLRRVEKIKKIEEKISKS